jgi:hypothetical protein
MKKVATYANSKETLREKLNVLAEEAGNRGRLSESEGINPGAIAYVLSGGESNTVRRKLKIYKGERRYRIIVETDEKTYREFNELCENEGVPRPAMMKLIIAFYKKYKWLNCFYS